MSLMLTFAGRATDAKQTGGGGSKTLQSIIVSPSPGVVYLTTSQAMTFSPSGHIENGSVVNGAVLYLV